MNLMKIYYICGQMILKQENSFNSNFIKRKNIISGLKKLNDQRDYVVIFM